VQQVLFSQRLNHSVGLRLSQLLLEVVERGRHTERFALEVAVLLRHSVEQLLVLDLRQLLIHQLLIHLRLIHQLLIHLRLIHQLLIQLRLPPYTQLDHFVQ
jgi:hypothetical protein